MAAGTAGNAAPGAKAPKPTLAFRADGTFKVVQFNDTQDDEQTDRSTLELMERTLDSEKPDFLVINGDVIKGACVNELEVKQALNHVVVPMESRSIPWAVTFGNHDEDSVAATGLTGTSNTQLLVQSSTSKGKDPAFGLWLIDTGRYAPANIDGQDFAGYPSWDWVRMDQVSWYHEQSLATEKKYGKKVPSLMWGHIALHEHRNMWFTSINSGLFNAFLERGDVKGNFAGHDRVNTYVGSYYGVQLGFAPGSGFGAYGLPINQKKPGKK